MRRSLLGPFAAVVLFSFCATSFAKPDDAERALESARKNLASAERVVEDVRRAIASHAEALGDVRDDLEKARKEQAVLLPLLRRAHEDAQVTLKLAKDLSAERKAARESAAEAVRQQTQVVADARAALDRQVEQEEALIASSDEYRAAREAAAKAKTLLDEARTLVLTRLDAEPAFVDMKRKLDRLEQDVATARAENAPDLPEISRQWIDAKGQYESARLTRLRADATYTAAEKESSRADAALRSLHETLLADLGIAQDVAAAQQRLDDETARLATARKALATADDHLRDSEKLLTERERNVREWQALPARLDDRVKASEENVQSIGRALVNLAGELETAKRHLSTAQEAVTDAERAVKKS